MPASKRHERRIPDHRHCVVCGRAIQPDKQYCSEEHKDMHELARRREKRARNIVYLTYFIITLLIFVWLFSSLMGG